VKPAPIVRIIGSRAALIHSGQHTHPELSWDGQLTAGDRLGGRLARVACPYGDGTASEQIAARLRDYLN
jgi:hypothetical protein